MMLPALNLPTFGNTSWHNWARARVPDIATPNAWVSEEFGPEGERALVIGTQNGI